MRLDLSDLDLDGVRPAVAAVPSAKVVAFVDVKADTGKSCGGGVPGCCECSVHCTCFYSPEAPSKSRPRGRS
jgi:hypothetical protein